MEYDRSLGEMAKDALSSAAGKAKELVQNVKEKVATEMDAAEAMNDQVEFEEKHRRELLQDAVDRKCRVVDVGQLKEKHVDIDSVLKAEDELEEMERRDRLGVQEPAPEEEKQRAEETVAQFQETRAEVLA